MDQYYLKELTVPIPEDKLVVIRKGKSVEYETDRIYSPETKNTRVVRRVIGRVDPVNPGRMFPNETYFQLFPENKVPAEVRDEFLRGCEIKRQMQTIRRNPEEIIEGVVNGLSELGAGGRNVGDGSESGGFPIAPRAPFGSHNIGSLNYVILRRLFDDVYYSVEELASKYPNEVIAPFKVKQINEVLEEIRKNVDDEGIRPYLRLVEEPEIAEENGSTMIKGLTYSDVLMMLKWYKVLPR